MVSQKIVLIGDFSTGKTSLIRRFVDNSFSDTYLSTMGVKVSTKQIQTPQETVRALIWDVEGGTESKPMNETYLLGAHGGIVVADITRQSSMEHISNYIDIAKRNAPDIKLIIALNKQDLVEQERAQELQAALRRSMQHNAKEIFLTSAKTGYGVEAMFTSLAQTLLAG